MVARVVGGSGCRDTGSCTSAGTRVRAFVKNLTTQCGESHPRILHNVVIEE